MKILVRAGVFWGWTAQNFIGTFRFKIILNLKFTY